jgi:hypothetical protein
VFVADAEAFVEAARRVPIQHREVEPAIVALERDRREIGDEPAADAVAARPILDEDVFEIKPRPPSKRGVGPKPSRSRSASLALTASGIRSNAASARMKARSVPTSSRVAARTRMVLIPLCLLAR